MTEPAIAGKGTKKGIGTFWAWCAEREAARDTVRAMLTLGAEQMPWRGTLAVPPRSPMDGLLGMFLDETDIPLEVPFFALLHFVSGMLLSRRIKIQGSCIDAYPDLWTIVLAPSGSGKTLAHDVIAKAAPVQSTFPEIASGARFIEALQTHNFALWFTDEFAQKLKQIETPGSPMADIKDYLLRAYGYSKIERSTKKGTITIAEPCLGILGLNTIESFLKALSPESLLDGFAARFAYVVAERDPNRPMIEHPIYNLERLGRAATSAFAQIQSLPLPPVYRVGATAESAFRESFRALFRAEMPEAFYRRILYRSFKYATVYHVLLGKDSDTVDAVDMGWAARVALLHLQDMRKIAGRVGLLHETIQVVERVRQRRYSMQPLPLTARIVQQYVRKARTADDARALLALAQ